MNIFGSSIEKCPACGKLAMRRELVAIEVIDIFSLVCDTKTAYLHSECIEKSGYGRRKGDRPRTR